MERCIDTLPEPQIIKLRISGVNLYFYTFSNKPIDEIELGELKPCPAMDADAWLSEILTLSEKHHD